MEPLPDSQICDPDPRPSCGAFDPAPFVSFVKSTNLVNIPLTLLGIYLVLFKSSRAMKTYSWFLLFHVVALEFVNIQYSLLIIPWFIFPVWGGMALGLYSDLNIPGIVQLVILLTCISLTLTSTVWLFYYRAQVVLPDRHRLKHSTRGMIVFMTAFLLGNIVAALHLCFLFAGEHKEDAMKEEYEMKFDCKMTILSDPRVHVMDPKAGQYLMMFFNFYFLVIISIVALFTAPIFRHLLSETNLSKSTKKLQLSFLRALSIQMSINFMFIIIPTMVLMAIKGIAADRQHVNEICMIVQSLNNTGDLLALILLNRPYRQAIFCGRIWTRRHSTQKIDTKISLM